MLGVLQAVFSFMMGTSSTRNCSEKVASLTFVPFRRCNNPYRLQRLENAPSRLD